jgi:uncharacterized protein YaaW (UPF0174 family)
MKRKIAFAAVMGVITTGIISFTLISVNMGFGSNFAAVWLRSWTTAYVVVIPVILIVSPIVQSFVNYIFRERTPLNIE